MLLCWYNFKYRCFWSHLLNWYMNIWSICFWIIAQTFIPRAKSSQMICIEATDYIFDWWCMIALHIFFCVSQRNVRMFWTLNLVKVMNCSFGTAHWMSLCVWIIVIILCKALQCSCLMQNFAFSEFLIFFTCGFVWHFLHNTF